MWVAVTDLPTAVSHPFYRRLNQLLREHGFDDFTEAQCASFYAETMGRPGLPPGIYFRLLLIGYFEGIDSERGIAWRAADSLALRDFIGVSLEDAPPDHSTISRTRRLIDLETHRAVFTWVLQCLSMAGLVKGKTVGIDATTLEANAALRSIVRRDTGEGYEEFLTRLAKASGIRTPTRADLARIDRKRKKKGSNDDWMHPHDPDAKVAKMKDGRTHLAHKAEHAIDLETGAIVGVTVQDADEGDTTTIQQTLPEAAEQLDAVAAVTDDAVAVIEEVVADKGYHSRTTIHDLETLAIRTYISEPDRGPQSWIDQDAERDAVYANRRRIHGARGKRLLRRRGELLERPCAHLYETGGLRRTHVRGHGNVLKRLLVHASAFNLGLWMRTLFGIGTPRALQGRSAAFATVFADSRNFTRDTIDQRWRQNVSLRQQDAR
jgi:transposase